MNDNDVVSVSVEWKASDLRDLNLEFHGPLTLRAVIVSGEDDVKMVISGQRKNVHTWVLVEHFNGDLESTNVLMQTATPAIGCCSRCGAGQVATHAPLCGSCDVEVTGAQATEILHAKMGAQSAVANPTRVRL